MIERPVIFADIAAVAIGAVAAAWVVISVVRTVVIPRPERVWLTTTSFELARRAVQAVARRIADPARRHRVLGTFAPVVLILLPLMWELGLVTAFAAIYWGLDTGSVADAIELSGSSLTTLGFVPAPTFTTRLLAVVQALLGLAIVALMISFLPTLYGTFSRREIAVGRLTTRAGEPPDPIQFIARLDAIDRLHHVGERWEDWENWFVELGETHTTFPALVYFRSARPQRSWLAAAEAALDTAAVLRATGLVEMTGQADTMIRSGYLALRDIADFYDIDAESHPTDPNDLSVTRSDFDLLLVGLVDRGVTIDIDPNTAWRAFSGWRVNYDKSICGLRDLIADGPSHWSRARPPANG